MKSFAIISTFAVAVSAGAQSTYVPPTEELTTSTVYKTHEVTVTSCAPTVTDCPAKHTPYVTTVSEIDYTTVCPKETKTKTKEHPTYPVETHPTYPVEHPTYPVETIKTKTYPVETVKTKTYPVEKPTTYPVETIKTKTYPVETVKTKTYPVEKPTTYPVETKTYPVTISTISYSTSCPPKPTDETVTRPVESSTYTVQPPKYTVTYSQGVPHPSGTGAVTYPAVPNQPGQNTYPVPGQSTYPVASGQPPKPTDVYPSQYPIATGAAGKFGVSALVGLGAFAAFFL